VADTVAALVIRAGCGPTGESFPLDTERLTVGRRPSAHLLDDVPGSPDLRSDMCVRGSDYYRSLTPSAD